MGVNRPGDQFLPRSRLALQQDSDGRRDRALHQLEHPCHGRRRPDDLLVGPTAAHVPLERRHLHLQPRLREPDTLIEAGVLDGDRDGTGQGV